MTTESISRRSLLAGGACVRGSCGGSRELGKPQRRTSR